MRGCSALLRSFMVFSCAVWTKRSEVAAVDDGGGDLDLYVPEIFSKYDEYGGRLANSSQICSTCTEENGCIVSLGFHIQSECDNFDETYFRTEYNSTTDTICVDTYQDENCLILEEKCTVQWPVDQCVAGNGETRLLEVNQGSRLPNWCIRSGEPRDGFVVPMIRQTFFHDLSSCENMANVSLSTMIPAFKSLCFREPVDTLPNATKVPGSARAFCDGNSFVAELYSDGTCSNQTHPAETYFPKLSVSNNCSNPLLSYGFDEYEPRRFANCGSQTIYCREFADVIPFATEIPGLVEPASSPSILPVATPTNTPSADPSTQAHVPSTVVDGGGDLDLYIQEVFTKYDEESGISFENSSQVCNTCTEDNGCIVALNFQVESECDFLNEVNFRAEYNGTTDSICLNTYQDKDCTILEQSCSEELPANQCTENKQVTRLPKWCIRSSMPQEGFVVPMIRQKYYPDLDSCKNMTNVLRSVLSPSSTSSCLREPVDTLPNYTVVPGSARVHCDGNVYVAELFSDRSCSNQTNPAETLFPQFNISDVCTNPLLPYFNESERGQIANCGSQTIYCQEFSSSVRFASEIPAVIGPTSSPSTSPTLAPVSKAPITKTESPSTSTSEVPGPIRAYFVELLVVSALLHLIPV